MKKLICIVAAAALIGACEQKTEVAPASPTEKKADKPVDPNTGSKSQSALGRADGAAGAKVAASPTP